ncbi:UPF0481 protein At3g47200-like [Aristolochia californica]|uniref:UPF0481 protein At3g47200-like n=1 Tax=Aristolochia californica TaxID=171875 RepID=UPI0035DE4BB9
MDEIEGFELKLLADYESGFRPLFVRNPTTTIYTVPRCIREVKPEAYNYRYQYFGITLDELYPRPELEDRHLLSHMHSILPQNRSKTFKDYLFAMNEVRDQIRECYLVETKVDFKCLIALVLSCCHILDVLLLFFKGELTPQVDQLCSTGLQDLCMDMLLVQSQVPFFALQKIYCILDLDHSLYPSLVELCLIFFKEFLDFNKPVDPMTSESTHHLLHLVHYHFLTVETRSYIPSRPIRRQPLIIHPIPSVRRLLDAGIQFKKNQTIGLSNIIFEGDVLEIPYLHIDNHTEILLRNMIAWEQCHPRVGAYFTSYAIFMDFIINTAEDIEILNRHGILEQTLGSEEQVASIFNGLSTNVFYNGDENDFLPIVCRKLNDYRPNPINIVRANLINNYFGNPWTAIPVATTLFVVILTITQTIFFVYVYFHPR